MVLPPGLIFCKKIRYATVVGRSLIKVGHEPEVVRMKPVAMHISNPILYPRRTIETRSTGMPYNEMMNSVKMRFISTKLNGVRTWGNFKRILKRMNSYPNNDAGIYGVTRTKSPNVNKSCPKMISQEKWLILTFFKYCLRMWEIWAKLSVANGFKKLPKVQ